MLGIKIILLTIVIIRLNYHSSFDDGVNMTAENQIGSELERFLAVEVMGWTPFVMIAQATLCADLIPATLNLVRKDKEWIAWLGSEKENHSESLATAICLSVIEWKSKNQNHRTKKSQPGDFERWLRNNP